MEQDHSIVPCANLLTGGTGSLYCGHADVLDDGEGLRVCFTQMVLPILSYILAVHCTGCLRP